MSTVNRAFIRAYSKEVPVMEPTAHQEPEPVASSVSPYAPLPVVRKSPPKYRAETSLSPWGSSGSGLSLPQVAELLNDMESPAPTYLESVTPQPFVLSPIKPVVEATIPETPTNVKAPVAASTSAAPISAASAPLVLKPAPIQIKSFESLGDQVVVPTVKSVVAPVVESTPEPSPSQWESVTNFAQLPAAQSLSVGEYLCISGTNMASDVHLALTPPAVEFIDLMDGPAVETPVVKNKPVKTLAKPTENKPQEMKRVESKRAEIHPLESNPLDSVEPTTKIEVKINQPSTSEPAHIEPTVIAPPAPMIASPKIEAMVSKSATIAPPVIEVKLHDKFEYNAPVAPKVAPSPTDFIYPPAAVATVVEAALPLAEPVKVEAKVEATIKVKEEVKVEVAAEAAKKESPATEPTKLDMEVLWEVDRYLFPPMTDRLLRSYAYFSQAGEKLKHAAEAGLKILAVTGIARGEGRTTLAVCLARAAAQAGMRVGLFDCDFTNPSLATSLGLEIDHGWRHLLTGKLNLQEIAIRSVDEGITLFPLTSKDAGSGLRLLDPRVGKIIRESAEYVDLLILDLGPWGDLQLPAESHLPFDAAIVVRDCRHHMLDDVQPTAKLLQNAGVEAVGIAENFTAVG